MHPSVMAWVNSTLSLADIKDRTVLEVGSYNVNGTVRPIVEARDPASYLGVDQTPGPNVDKVVLATDLVDIFGAESFDVVISTEMLEHAEDWRACLWAMAEVLVPGGLLVLTTRSPGFPFHPFPVDCWRFTLPVMSAALTAVGLGSHKLYPDPGPKAPGVFVRAYRSEQWRPNRAALAAVEPEPAPQR